MKNLRQNILFYHQFVINTQKTRLKRQSKYEQILRFRVFRNLICTLHVALISPLNIAEGRIFRRTWPMCSHKMFTLAPMNRRDCTIHTPAWHFKSYSKRSCCVASVRIMLFLTVSQVMFVMGQSSNPTSYFCKQVTILKLILYQDGSEVVKPLGSARKKHKLDTCWLWAIPLFQYCQYGVSNVVQRDRLQILWSGNSVF